jgi:hypothetical protein
VAAVHRRDRAERRRRRPLRRLTAVVPDRAVDARRQVM